MIEPTGQSGSSQIPVTALVESSLRGAGSGTANDKQFVDERGELRPAELVFRLGLLLGAGLFLIEGQGVPWVRGTFTFAAALLMGLLIVLTLGVQWRVLGDWRRRSQQAVLLGLAFVLSVPLAAAISPELSSSALPEILKNPMMAIMSSLEKIPGFSAALAMMKGIIVFAFFCLTMVVLLASSGPSARGGFALILFALVGVSIFFHPSAETVVGLVLLGFFLRIQWETPLMVPDKLRQHLSASQCSFLRELLRAGALSPGEARLYLDNEAQQFAELVDYGLVDYDRMVREVRPGRRLLVDPANETLSTALGYFRKGLWLLAGVVYFFLPDLIPGPLDDLVVMAICAGAGLGWLGSLMGRRKPVS